MLKIKLLILLLISTLLFSCTSNQKIISDKKYSLGYIPGEYDGLIFAQFLKNSLMDVQALDKNSKFKITGKIKHTDDIFVTNIDNTSDRQRVDSSIEILIEDLQGKCPTYNYAQFLKNSLMDVQALDKNSKFKITGKIKHTDDIFVTNIDNTSDRQRVDSSIEILIEDLQGKCPTYNYNDQISQFYVFASSEKFVSNQLAEKKIRSQNTEVLVNNFIKNVIYKDLYCNGIK